MEQALPESMLAESKLIANNRDVPYQSLVKVYLAVSPLIAGLFHVGGNIKWYAVSALGGVMAVLAKEDMEAARIIMRRLIWSLNGESGSIGWGSRKPWRKSWPTMTGSPRNMPKQPKIGLLNRKIGQLNTNIPSSPIPHPIFCGQNSIDTKNLSNYTSPVKKQCPINPRGGSINPYPSQEKRGSMRNTDSVNNSAIHWAWIILAVCFVNLFVNYGIRLGYGVILPEMIRTLGLSRRQAGDIYNAYILAYICLSLFVGNLTDRFGARKIIPPFGIILGTGTMLMGTADSFSQASLFFAIVGVGAASMWTPIITLVQKWFAIERRGMALGILSTGFGLGFASVGGLFPIIVAEWSWRYCWYFLGIAAFIMVLVNLFFLRSKPEDKGLTPWGTRSDDNPSVSQATCRPKEKTNYSKIITTTRFWVLGSSYLLIAGSLYIPTTFMVDYARHELSFPFGKASLLATIHGIGQIVGVLTIGIVSDYLGRRMTILLSNLCIAASIMCMVASGGNEVWLFTSVAALGAFFGATFPMYGAAGGDYFRKEIMGTVIGALTIFYGTGAILAHRLSGHIRDATGSFAIPFTIAIVASIIAAVLMGLVKQPAQENE